jgi:ribosomal protein L37AE/L43A
MLCSLCNRKMELLHRISNVPVWICEKCPARSTPAKTGKERYEELKKLNGKK